MPTDTYHRPVPAESLASEGDDFKPELVKGRTVGTGDVRQIALFCHQWREQSDAFEALGGAALGVAERQLPDGAKVTRRTVHSSDVGGVGWGNISNILMAALRRRRSFYDDPCKCEECLVYSAANAKKPIYHPPKANTEVVGRINVNNATAPLASTATAGSAASAATTGEAQHHHQDDLVEGQPVFSYSTVFGDISGDRREVLANGGGMGILRELAVIRGHHQLESNTQSHARVTGTSSANAKGRSPKPPPTGPLPFVPTLLRHNTPCELVSLTSTNKLSDVSIACVANHIGWHQQLVDSIGSRSTAAAAAAAVIPPTTTAAGIGTEVSDRLAIAGVDVAEEWILKDLRANSEVPPGEEIASLSQQKRDSRLLLRNIRGPTISRSEIDEFSAFAEAATSIEDGDDWDSSCVNNPHPMSAAAVFRRNLRTFLGGEAISDREHGSSSSFLGGGYDDVGMSADTTDGDAQFTQPSYSGTQLLLHPLANTYRPTSIAVWNETVEYGNRATASHAIARHIALCGDGPMGLRGASSTATTGIEGRVNGEVDHATPTLTTDSLAIACAAPCRISELCFGAGSHLTPLLIPIIGHSCTTLKVLIIDNVSGIYQSNRMILVAHLTDLLRSMTCPLETLVVAGMQGLLDGRRDGGEGVVGFARNVASSPTLTHLALDRCGISNAEALRFWEACFNIQSSPSATNSSSQTYAVGFHALQHLSLADNRLTGSVVPQMADVVSAARKAQTDSGNSASSTVRTIRSLDLSRNDFSELSGTVLAQSLTSLLDGGDHTATKRRAGWVGISLRHTMIRGAEVGKFLRGYRRLAGGDEEKGGSQPLLGHFSLSGGNYVTVADLKGLADCFIPSVLPVANLSNLSSLDLSWTQLRLESGGSNAFPTTHHFFTQTLPQLLPSLRVLNLSHCGLDDDGCARLAACFEKVVTQLAEGGMSSTGAAAGGDAPTSKPAAGKGTWGGGKKSLEKQAKKATNAKCVKGSVASSANNDDTPPPSNLLTVGLPLQQLRLDGNPITAEGLRYVVRAVRANTCPSLEVLGLASIGDETEVDLLGNSGGGGYGKKGVVLSAASSAPTRVPQGDIFGGTSVMGAPAAPRGGGSSATASASAARYAFKDLSGQMLSPYANALRTLVAQVNHTAFHLLDLSGNPAFISHLPLAEDLTKLFSNTRAKLVAAENTTNSSGTHVASPPLSVPVMTMVLRNIDRNWEADMVHSARCTYPYAQCVFA